MLSKKDILLAQKTFESRKLRYELKSRGKPYTPLEGKRRPRAVDDFSLDTSLPDISPMGSPTSGKQRPMTSMLMSPVNTNSSSSSKMFVNTATQSNTMALSSSMSKSASEGALGMGITAHQELPGETQQLISELAQRGMTDQGQLRKTVGDVAKHVNATAGALDYSDPEVLSKTMSSDYYMPKVTITLPNGASLMEIYRSKQADMWGRIIKAQLKEENEKKIQDKINKEKSNEMFGKLLKDQLNDNERRRRALDGQDDYLAAITEASSKRSDDIQRQRREDAIERQKKFIMHALEDIETKRVKREKALRQEIEASTMSNNKTRALIALDEKNRAEKKAAEMLRLEKLFQENQASLKRKELAKQALNAETKRIMAQAELNFEKQEARRKDDLSKIFKVDIMYAYLHRYVQTCRANGRKQKISLASSISYSPPPPPPFFSPPSRLDSAVRMDLPTKLQRKC